MPNSRQDVSKVEVLFQPSQSLLSLLSYLRTPPVKERRKTTLRLALSSFCFKSQYNFLTSAAFGLGYIMTGRCTRETGEGRWSFDCHTIIYRHPLPSSRHRVPSLPASQLKNLNWNDSGLNWAVPSPLSAWCGSVKTRWVIPKRMRSFLYPRPACPHRALSEQDKIRGCSNLSCTGDFWLAPLPKRKELDFEQLEIA